jgi:hypothetical protein
LIERVFDVAPEPLEELEGGDGHLGEEHVDVTGNEQPDSHELTSAEARNMGATSSNAAVLSWARILPHQPNMTLDPRRVRELCTEPEFELVVSSQPASLRSMTPRLVRVEQWRAASRGRRRQAQRDER